MRYYITALLLFSQWAFSQLHLPPKTIDFTKEKVWVDSIYNKMSMEERIGQLFMVAAYSNKDSAHIRSIDKLVKDYHVGGVIFFQGGPVRQAKLTNRYQSKARVPLFVGIDAEWGVAMRLDSVIRYPWNMTLGAVQDLKLIKEVGERYGIQSRRMGVHFNFAPVLDINTNPKNPIIGNRSFGEDKINVTNRALALMKGIQSQGVLATGKHFPGHGDTATDSHHTLPMLNFSRERINEVELYPYKRLIREGLSSVMVAHLNVPVLEPRDNFPTSVSYNVVTNLLQKELHFNGLIFTDALNMKGASNFKQPGEIDFEAFVAGNDVLLFAENVPLAMEKICMAIQDTILPESRLEKSVKKILKYKYQVGLNQYHPIDLAFLYDDLNSPETEAFQYKLYENALTVLKNEEEILPIQNLEEEKIAYLKLGDDSGSMFLNTLKQYTEITEITKDSLHLMQEKLNNFTKVIIGFHKADGAWKKHDFTIDEIVTIQEIAKKNKVILDVFAKPYSLIPFNEFKDIEGLIVSYQNSDPAQNVSAQLIFGAVESKGKLPVSIGNFFKVNDGLKTKKLNRLGFTIAENVGMNSKVLDNIDNVANNAIERNMTPGIQVLVARKGKVVYQKSYGYHDYTKQVKVKNSDIYDVASLTKMVATLPLTMQLFDQKKVNLETKLGQMLPEFEKTDKSNISFKELMSHYGKLQPWLPFYQSTLTAQKEPDSLYYSRTLSSEFPLQVSENLFLRKDYPQLLLKQIADSKLLTKREYKYSDFTFILLKEFVEKSFNQPLDKLADEHFYKKLGANKTTYNPLRKFDQNIIPPTEEDNYFRYTTVQGYVHDMAAAMQDGVGGHAGIFSNSMDLAKIMQMYLQKGNYGGKQFFSPSTFDIFNTCHYCKEGNRRGLGFDKPQLPGTSGPTCNCTSKSSFGHTGFTGTMAWADPEQELIYIFLSNRTYPDSNAPNWLSQENVRENIQKVIYNSIEK
ncbi:serine hydrolase [Flavobacterium sp. NST-5]|uniref:beta-N-acetylhexosaminidase n=1 Tax=Flavobacterium ichthyis TaxID=2698827 RepID=A0ABW9Z9Z2_9FLAO|nr:glycoside hydrolase family 3 N-terminal domain-containing protein [Flavobacterium ichthyis]NBL65708.1 serine hydrolase [Flavobacterium ichthyis]